MDPKLWKPIKAFAEREEKIQINPKQYAVRKVLEPIECWVYIGEIKNEKPGNPSG